MPDLFGGQIQTVADFNTGLPLPRDRNPTLPDVPTFSEPAMPRWIDWNKGTNAKPPRYAP